MYFYLCGKEMQPKEREESGCLVSLASAFSSGASPRNCAILGGKKSPKHRPREAMEAEPG